MLTNGKQGKKQKDGKNRYQKRLKSKVRSNVSQLNKVDFNKVFKENIVTVGLEVDGETDKYLVTISFGTFLDELHQQLERDPNLCLRSVVRALLIAFNSDNVYFNCTCADFTYRHKFWATKNNLIVGDKELRPADITNPNNDLGPACKHIMLVISNTSWIVKLASVVFNYINYMEKHYKKLYADIIYPAVYQKEYEEPVQLSFDELDVDELDTSSDKIDVSNKYARDKNKFKAGNTQGVRFAPKPEKDKYTNRSIFDLDED